MNKILDYLKETYNPLAIVTYGSFTCGMNDAYSDFDCMIIVDQKNKSHDDKVIDGVQLDCFIFTVDETADEDVDPFLTIYDGHIVWDTDGIADTLRKRVQTYVAEHTVIDDDEKQLITSWIRKTIHRAEKNDDEGSYRVLALLWESLTDYFLLRDMFYFGSKKAAAWLKENDAAGYQLYHNAITGRSNAAIIQWAEYVVKQPDIRRHPISEDNRE